VANKFYEDFKSEKLTYLGSIDWQITAGKILMQSIKFWVESDEFKKRVALLLKAEQESETSDKNDEKKKY
jgi:hypothetical protein